VDEYGVSVVVTVSVLSGPFEVVVSDVSVRVMSDSVVVVVVKEYSISEEVPGVTVVITLVAPKLGVTQFPTMQDSAGGIGLSSGAVSMG
jgi:hypothetical protein